MAFEERSLYGMQRKGHNPEVDTSDTDGSLPAFEKVKG